MAEEEFYRGQRYAENEVKLLDDGTLTNTGNLMDFAPLTKASRFLNKFTKGLVGSETPIADREWGRWQNTSSEDFNKILNMRTDAGRGSYAQGQAINYAFNFLNKHKMLTREGEYEGEYTIEDFRNNKNLYKAINNNTGNSFANYQAAKEWELSKDSSDTGPNFDKNETNSFVSGMLQSTNNDSLEDDTELQLNDEVFSEYTGQLNDGLGLDFAKASYTLTYDPNQFMNNSDNVSVLKTTQPLAFYNYKEAKDKYDLINREVSRSLTSEQKNNPFGGVNPNLARLDAARIELQQTKNKLFSFVTKNEDGTETAGIFPILERERDALLNRAADNDGAYITGAVLTSLGIELIPVIGVGGAITQGAFKGIYKGSKILIQNGKLVPASFQALMKRVGPAEAKAVKAQLELNTRGKLIFNEETGQASFQNDNIAYMSDGSYNPYYNKKVELGTTGNSQIQQALFKPKDPEINKLYEGFRSGKIEIPDLYGYNKKPTFADPDSYFYTKNFADLTGDEKFKIQRSLGKYKDFLKLKGNKITPNEVQSIFEKNIKGYASTKTFSSEVNRTGQKNTFLKSVNEILEPGRIQTNNNALFFKKPTEAQLKKLQLAWDNRGVKGITSDQVIKINKLANNSVLLPGGLSVKEYIIKNRKLPPIAEVQKILGGNASPSQAGYALTNYLSLLDGGTFTVNGKTQLSKIRTNKLLANEVFEDIRKTGGNSYLGQTETYKAAADRMTNIIIRGPNQTQMSMKVKARAFAGGKDVHEPASMVTAARFNLSSYANFVTPENARYNREIIRASQSYLSRMLSSLKTPTNPAGTKNIDDVMKSYNKYVADKVDLRAEDVVTILPPTRKAIEDWYGVDEVARYLKEYGMDLVGEAQKAGFAFGIPKKAKVLDDVIKNGTFNFAKGGTVRKLFSGGTRNGKLVQDDQEPIIPTGETIYGDYLKNLNLKVQKTLRAKENMDKILSAKPEQQMAMSTLLGGEEERKVLEDLRSMPNSVRTKYNKVLLDVKDVKQKIAESLRDPRPVNWKLSDSPKLLGENIFYKKFKQQLNMGPLIMGSIANDIQNKMSSGDPKSFEERYPVLAKNLLTPFAPTAATADEAKYIDGFEEINRAIDTGLTNLSFNTMDLVLSGIDLGGYTNLSGKLREMYEEKSINEPETFLGDMLSVLVEFGVPGGVVSKILTRAQKALRVKGINTMTRYVDTDLARQTTRGLRFTNLAKRVGTGAVIFGAADFAAGGPYNSLERMIGSDNTTLLPGKPEETDNLTGAELAKANFRNRVRFAADGALIGGLFPLAGPAIWGITKKVGGLPLKTIPGINRSALGGTLQLAGIPLKLAADVLAGKVPYTQKMIPVIGKSISSAGQKTASAIQTTAALVGKNVFARAALAAYDVKNAAVNKFIQPIYQPGSTFAKNIPKIFGGEGGGLPDFQAWRNFTVNNADPLHANLARIDNKLAMFRDIGKLTKDAFGLKNTADAMTKAKSRTIDKMYSSIERVSYNMAKVFEDQHKQWGEYGAIQKKYLDDVLDFIEGNIKIQNVSPPLRKNATELKEYVTKLNNEFKDLLPEGNSLKKLLTADINGQMRKSFAMFTNSSFSPGADAVLAAKNYVAKYLLKQPDQIAEARKAFPEALDDISAVNSLAELRVGDMMHVARYEMQDPIRAFRKIVNRLENSGVPNLVDPLEIFTGQELPAVIRTLMGQETSLKNSLMQTTGNIISSTQQKKALDALSKMGTDNKWLFNTSDEALTIGKIRDAERVSDIKGAGFLPSDILGKYGSPEIVAQLQGYSLFDGMLKQKWYQNLLAMKSMVQGGKTLYSPATQMRNFGSAGLFAMNVGHIGGNTSVTQNFKIMLDDIFGAGPGVDESSLIKWIERKIELGVLDENVVANELGGILQDLKSVTGKNGEPKIGTIAALTNRIGETKITQTVQRLYAGGDNVWKAYGHEFYMSELTQFTKSLDDVAEFFRTQVGREFVPMQNGVKKTLAEGIEEMGAHLLRETYPTYSRVPPVIQALRKAPLGNFISFPAEMIRTSLSTTASSMKMIGSNNPGLQAMGYRALMGQFTTMYGFNHGAQKLAMAMTGVDEDKLRAYQDDLGPSFVDDHILIPITKQNENGTFKAFDASTYNPYNYLVGPVESFIRNLSNTRLDPSQVDSELNRRFFDQMGPFMKLIDPFIGETIALEPILDIFARNGLTRDGNRIFSELDSPADQRDKAIAHTLKTIAPGFVRSAGQVMGALTLDTKGGRVMEIGDVLIRLMGGSIMNVDPISALEYKAIDIRKIRGAAFQTEHFFSKTNALERGPILDEFGRQKGHVMANEFRDIQEEAFVAQFAIHKMFQKSLASGLLKEHQIKKVLGPTGRNVPNLRNLMNGVFTPVSFSKDALKKRAEDLVAEYARNGITVSYDDLYPKFDLIDVINEFKYMRFEERVDPDRKPLPEIPLDLDSIPMAENVTDSAPIPVQPLASNVTDTQETPVPNQTVMGQGQINQATGLTSNETALLSPSEQLIRQKQRGSA